MARAKVSADPVELEKLEWPYDWPPPWRNERLVGHDTAERTMLAAQQTGKLHHAWLLTGPRGIGKAEAAVDHWMKEIAPSTELRKWFGHDPARWEEFQRRYRSELKDHRDELDRLRELTREGVVTLVYAARDEAHNDAVVLRDLLISTPDD